MKKCGKTRRECAIVTLTCWPTETGFAFSYTEIEWHLVKLFKRVLAFQATYVGNTYLTLCQHTYLTLCQHKIFDYYVNKYLTTMSTRSEKNKYVTIMSHWTLIMYSLFKKQTESLLSFWIAESKTFSLMKLTYFRFASNSFTSRTIFLIWRVNERLWAQCLLSCYKRQC